MSSYKAAIIETAIVTRSLIKRPGIPVLSEIDGISSSMDRHRKYALESLVICSNKFFGKKLHLVYLAVIRKLGPKRLTLLELISKTYLSSSSSYRLDSPVS